MGLKAKTIGWALLAKTGIATAIILTYSFHADIKKAEYNVLDRKQPVAQYFYANPPILEVDWKTNDYGKIETYLVNKETGKKNEILYDLLPSNKTMIDAIKKRMEEGFDIYDGLKQDLDSIMAMMPKKETEQSQDTLSTEQMLKEIIRYYEVKK